MSRPINEVWKDLEELCILPGYIHIIIKLWGDLHTDYGELSNYDRLTISEISILIGLMIKKNINEIPPAPEIANYYEKKTKCLMRELHDADNGDFTMGNFLKEASMYSKRSPLNFQYLECAKQKYGKDNEWLLENKGFTIRECSIFVESVHNIFTKNKLCCYHFTFKELMYDSQLSENVVQSIINSFSIKPESECNHEFKQIGDYNQADSHPIISLGQNEYLLLEPANFCKSVYQSPALWMNSDTNYKDKASKNRGEFTESFVANKLNSIFGLKDVYKNVKIKTKKQVVGEIDVLVLDADKIIVVQAKSKGLTMNSRKGNEFILKKDFEDSIQAAYDQATACAEYLLGNNHNFYDENDNKLNINNIQDIVIFCVLADDYPGLPAHVRQFLKYDPKYLPYVVDIFTLDIIKTVLNKPSNFLDFINKRTKYFRQIITNSELDVLYYYMECDLIILPGCEIFQVPDDFTRTLDDIMIKEYLNNKI